MNGIVLGGVALSLCTKSMPAVIDDEASVESSFDDLQQFEEEEQAGRAQVIYFAMQNLAEGLVASEARC
jgi:hypothetical protein